MEKRLDYILANAGVGGRTEVKKMIRSGAVTVDGATVTDPAVKTDPSREIMAGGVRVILREFVYLMMNKPAGVICATEDRALPTVCDLIPQEYAHFAPYPVGRLDRDTEGFVLLTNDGELAHRIISPKHHVPKEYYALVDGRVTAEHCALFERGVTLEDGTLTLPSELTVLHSGEQSEIRLVLYEGKFHQVKRMVEAIGGRVTFLKRLRIGSIPLDPSLGAGETRELTDAELAQIKELTC